MTPLSRRYFLQTAAAGTVASLAASANIRAANAGGRKLRVAVIALGRGLAHVSALLQLPDVEIADIGHHRPVFRSGVAAADLVLASGATAVLCYNDLVALGVLRRLQDRGVRVPQDISVIGFDDIYAASLVAPALTTVSVPWARAGRNAVDLLLDAGSPKAKGPGLAVELVVRDSTAQRQAAMPAEAAQRP